MEDERILDLYWARSERAIGETAAKYGPYCTRIAMNILGDRGDADECVNDTYLRTWNAIPPQRPAILSAFLGRIARNLSLNRYKHRTARKRGGGEVALLLGELEACLPSGGGAEAEYEAAYEAQAIAAAIDAFLFSLDARGRIAFVRRYWYADSIRDIADRLGISEGTCKSLLHRTRGGLRAHLEREGVMV